MEIKLNIEAWSAWNPFAASIAEWNDYLNTAKHIEPGQNLLPKLSFVPSITRRRYSPLTRVMVHLAYILSQKYGNLPSVFASQHGEQYISQSLLLALAKSEPISPAKFSVSVHNSASGLFSILTGNTQPTTAIAGGKSSFLKGFIEAARLLQSGKEFTEVLYVYAEEPSTELFKDVIDAPSFLNGIGFILSTANITSDLVVTMTHSENALSTQIDPVEFFLKNVLEEASEFSFYYSGESWKLLLNCENLKSMFINGHDNS